MGRHWIHNNLLKINTELYNSYSSDYQGEFFGRWYRKQKRFRVPEIFIINHLPYYYLLIELIFLFRYSLDTEWWHVAMCVNSKFYLAIIWCYIIMLVRSIFTTNFLFSQMYYSGNTSYLEGMADANYFI